MQMESHWTHFEEKDKLSSDRLRRVQGSSRAILGSHVKRRKISSVETEQEGGPSPDQNVMKSLEIMVGDWIIFDLRNESIPPNLKDEIARQNGHILGVITGFRYKAENNRSLQYKGDFVSLTRQNQETNKIMALAIWYGCNENGFLYQIFGNFSVEITNYKYTIKPPIMKSESGNVSYILPFQYAELENLYTDCFTLHHSLDKSPFHDIVKLKIFNKIKILKNNLLFV